MPLILCMFIDQVAFMLAAIPIYSPIVQNMGVDPVWFWTLFAINLTIGSVTPPFGYTLFAMRAAAPVSLSTGMLFRASLPVVAIMLLSILLIAVFPPIATFLPSLLR